MTVLEKRQQLKQLIIKHKFMGYMLPRQEQRDAHLESVRKITQLRAQTDCPFTWKDLEAYKCGNIYPERVVLEDKQRNSHMFRHRGPIIQRPNITVQQGQQMDEWFDGYEVEQ